MPIAAGATRTLNEMANNRRAVIIGGDGFLEALSHAEHPVDLKHHRAGSEWKAVLKAKAKSALKTLARVAPV